MSKIITRSEDLEDGGIYNIPDGKNDHHYLYINKTWYWKGTPTTVSNTSQTSICVGFKCEYLGNVFNVLTNIYD